MTVVTKVSASTLQNSLDIDNNFEDITGSVIAGWATTIAGWIFKKSPVGISLLILQTAVKADADTIASRIKYMLENDYSYFVITSEYTYKGYMPGSSYPTYALDYQIYDYE